MDKTPCFQAPLVDNQSVFRASAEVGKRKAALRFFGRRLARDNELTKRLGLAGPVYGRGNSSISAAACECERPITGAAIPSSRSGTSSAFSKA